MPSIFYSKYRLLTNLVLLQRKLVGRVDWGAVMWEKYFVLSLKKWRLTKIVFKQRNHKDFLMAIILIEYTSQQVKAENRTLMNEGITGLLDGLKFADRCLKTIFLRMAY